MTSSLKIGAVSGLIAGIVSGTVSAFIGVPLLYGLDSAFWGLPPPPNTPMSLIASVEIALGLVFGIILGIIYSRAYGVIPGKGILKATLYGLFLYLIFNIRFATLFAAYGTIWVVISNVVCGLFLWIPFSIVLASLYEFLKGRYRVPEGPKIIEYDMRGSFHPSAIAGLVSGIGAALMLLFGYQIRLWLWVPERMMNIGFLLGQLGTHILFNMLWGVVFGIVFPKVYSIVPGKGVLKGLYYCLILFLIIYVRVIGEGLVYGYYLNVQLGIFWTKQLVFLGPSALIPFGLVLGALYKK